MQFVVVDINIPAADLARYYQRPGSVVLAKSISGQSVKFPANLLHSFIMHDGIKGRFRIAYTSDGKFHGIEKV